MAGSMLGWVLRNPLQGDVETSYHTTFQGPAGPLGGGWEGTWVRDGNGNANPRVSTPGTNHVANPGFELTTSWSAFGSPTVSERSAEQVLEGDYAWKIVGPNLSGIRQNVSPDTGLLTSVEGSFYVVSGVARLRHNFNGGAYENTGVPGTGAWYGLQMAVRPTASGYFQFQLEIGGTMYVDVSKVAALADHIAPREFDFAYGRIQVPITLAGKYDKAGIVLNYEDANNYAVVDLNQDNILVWGKYVSGIWSQIGSYAIAYVNGGILDVTRHQDGTVDITYADTSIVTGATASGLTGLKHGLLGSHNGLAFPSFDYTIAGVA
jgi:hypothetical protein